MDIQYQDFLLNEFRARRSTNPRYSLRSFARDIGMSAPKLSQNLRGLCGISGSRAEKIAQHLQISDEQKRLFVAMVEVKHARSLSGKKRAALTLRQMRGKLEKMSLDTFAMIRDWHHMALLEMMDLEGFRPDLQWIASRLGLNTETVAAAVERLQGLGLLKVDEDGRWRQTPSNSELDSKVPSAVIRDHHKQLLNKSIAAIDELPFEKRGFSSLTFAVDQKHFEDIKKMLLDVQHKIVELSQEGRKNSVYFLGIQFYPLAGSEE